LKKGVYNGSYRDRSDILKSAEKAGHIKEGVELEQISSVYSDYISKTLRK